jgi:hypothetical protein
MSAAGWYPVLKMKTPSRWKPALTLCLIAPILTELLSTNIPPSVFFKPMIFIFLATVGYGFPVLLLREFACRRRMGFAGLICLGLVYGILNEGILAKTFYLVHGVPVNTFDNYGHVLGISVPWALTIGTWHAFHALVYPVLFVYWFFPGQRSQSWIGNKTALCLAVPAVLFNTLIFFKGQEKREPGQLPHFALMLLIMGALIWIATKLPQAPGLADSKSFRLKPVFCGILAFVLLLFVPCFVSGAKVPVLLFYAYFLLVFALIFRWLFRNPVLSLTGCLLFAVGDDLAMVLFGVIGALRHASFQKLVTDAMFAIVFVLFLARLRKECLPQPPNAPGAVLGSPGSPP